MPDYKEKLLDQREDLLLDKEETQIVLDYYKERLKNITGGDNMIEPTGQLLRIEDKERKLEELTKQIAELSVTILNFDLQ